MRRAGGHLGRHCRALRVHYLCLHPGGPSFAQDSGPARIELPRGFADCMEMPFQHLALYAFLSGNGHYPEPGRSLGILRLEKSPESVFQEAEEIPGAGKPRQGCRIPSQQGQLFPYPEREFQGFSQGLFRFVRPGFGRKPQEFLPSPFLAENQRCHARSFPLRLGSQERLYGAYFPDRGIERPLRAELAGHHGELPPHAFQAAGTSGAGSRKRIPLGAGLGLYLYLADVGAELADLDSFGEKRGRHVFLGYLRLRGRSQQLVCLVQRAYTSGIAETR